MDSPTIVQVSLALAMLVALVGALWPKLACRTEMGDQSFSSRNRQSRLPAQRVTYRSAAYGRHALRVRESYDRMFGRWLHVDPQVDENPPNDQKAA